MTELRTLAFAVLSRSIEEEGVGSSDMFFRMVEDGTRLLDVAIAAAASGSTLTGCWSLVLFNGGQFAGQEEKNEVPVRVLAKELTLEDSIDSTWSTASLLIGQ
jgi:hypothetical protein